MQSPLNAVGHLFDSWCVIIAIIKFPALGFSGLSPSPCFPLPPFPHLSSFPLWISSPAAFGSPVLLSSLYSSFADPLVSTMAASL